MGDSVIRKTRQSGNIDWEQTCPDWRIITVYECSGQCQGLQPHISTKNHGKWPSPDKHTVKVILLSYLHVYLRISSFCISWLQQNCRIRDWSMCHQATKWHNILQLTHIYWDWGIKHRVEWQLVHEPSRAYAHIVKSLSVSLTTVYLKAAKSITFGSRLPRNQWFISPQLSWTAVFCFCLSPRRKSSVNTLKIRHRLRVAAVSRHFEQKVP